MLCIRIRFKTRYLASSNSNEKISNFKLGSPKYETQFFPAIVNIRRETQFGVFVAFKKKA
jgi:hypothetical protein